MSNITKSDSCVLWFTGLSGSGKTTISIMLSQKLKSLNKKVYIIDGDVIRKHKHKKLGFSREDIRKNNNLIAKKVNSILSMYDVILVPIISPYSSDRKMARKIIGDDNFNELFINTPLNECRKRDPKGLYKKVDSGQIDNFIGISKTNPYQIPKKPDIVIDTTIGDVKNSVDQIFNYLKNILGNYEIINSK